MNPCFDDALDITLELVHLHFPDRAPNETTVIRDALGVLTVVLPDGVMDADKLEIFASELHNALGRFSPGIPDVIVEQRDLIDRDDIIGSKDRVLLPNAPGVGLLDRLLTNQDWHREPLVARPPLPTAAFFSIKGGVGRSTAVAALAWYLAQIGRRVLVVDLDLEAPGVGGMMLAEAPDFGVADWCIESITGGADRELFERMLAPSPVADGASGSVMVVPAYGDKTKNYIAKVGRAYIPSLAAETMDVLGFSDRVLSLVIEASRRLEPPDVVLLDSRAGLHDIGSALVTQLGAEVFLFFRTDLQNRECYSRLFGHLQLARSVKYGMPDDDLRWRLKTVAAQLDGTTGAFEAALMESYNTWEQFYDMERDPGTGFALEDCHAPHYPLSTVFDPRIRHINFLDSFAMPTNELMDSVFGNFIRGATMRLFETSVEHLP